MKIFGTSALIGMGIFAGMIYVNDIQITNMQAFFLICIFIVIFSYTVPRQEDAHDILACSNKAVTLLSSFIIGAVGLLNLFYISGGMESVKASISDKLWDGTASASAIDLLETLNRIFPKVTVTSFSSYIPAILTLLASYSFINITLLIKSGKAKNSPFLCIPLIWITFELILVFKKVSANPILIEYILEFFVLSSCTVLLLQLAKRFCTTGRKVHFKASAIMTAFFVFSYYVVLFSGNHDIIVDFETIRFLILSSSLVLYTAPFYNKKH